MMFTQSWCQSLRAIVEQAGTLILSYYHTKLDRQEKPGGSFFTQADKASEQFLIAELLKLLPGAGIFAEESGKQRGTNEYVWVIDPLDGTTNFSRGLPYFCISVALTHNGKPIIGVIYNPLLQEYFFAQEGNGAYLNGQPIHISSIEQSSKSLVLVGLPYAKNDAYRAFFKKIETLMPTIYSFRHLGAAALDCAYVAAGRVDGLLFIDLAWWDVAAGVLLIQEAGGRVTDFHGNPITAEYRSFVAGNPAIYEELFTYVGDQGALK